MNTKPTSKTTAAETSIGFDYQFYYFFFCLINLRHGECIGLEVIDDLHIRLPNGNITLIQTKHSIKKNSKDEIKNLTERSLDLWKTISTWISLFNTESNPKDYLENHTFHLVTNKNDNNNPFLLKISYLCNNKISIKDFKEYLKNLAENTDDNEIKEYILKLKKISDPIALLFLKKIHFEFKIDNLIKSIKERLLEKIHIEERIEDVYNSLHSSLRDKNYLSIKKGAIFEITFKDFNTNFKHCFKKGLNTKLPIREHQIILPQEPYKQLFIIQLVDINAISINDNEDIIELTTHMLMTYNNLSEWESSGEIGPTERRKFDENSIQLWKNSFASKFRNIKQQILNNNETVLTLESAIQSAATECLDEIRKTVLTLEETLLDIKLSNGHFYLLTEGRKIGWHYDWKNKYI